jgi:ABC-type uncharacterized transport system permease subunit
LKTTGSTANNAVIASSTFPSIAESLQLLISVAIPSMSEVLTPKLAASKFLLGLGLFLLGLGLLLLGLELLLLGEAETLEQNCDCDIGRNRNKL